jgi:hypothetical protein
MPLTRSRDHSPAPQISEEEQRLRDKRRRQFEMVLEDAADEKAAVLITVLKDLGEKKFKENQAAVQGYLIRFIVLSGEHVGHCEDEWPVYKRGFTNRIEKAGVGATMVARLGRYGDRKAIGLEDDQDGDVELAEKALAKFGDPFEDARPGQLAEETADAKKSVKEKAAAKAAAASDDEIPF